MITTDRTTLGPGPGPGPGDTAVILSLWAPSLPPPDWGTANYLGNKTDGTRDPTRHQSVIHLAEHSYPHMLLSDRDINYIFMAQFGNIEIFMKYLQRRLRHRIVKMLRWILITLVCTPAIILSGLTRRIICLWCYYSIIINAKFKCHLSYFVTEQKLVVKIF